MKPLEISINIVPRSKMRYDTLDDYHRENGRLVVDICGIGNNTYERMLLIHALTEQLICEYMGISDETITAWDRAHLHSPEPGDAPGCPYLVPHGVAMAVERMIAAVLKIPWEKYEQDLERALHKEEDPPPKAYYVNAKFHPRHPG